MDPTRATSATRGGLLLRTTAVAGERGLLDRSVAGGNLLRKSFLRSTISARPRPQRLSVQQETLDLRLPLPWTAATSETASESLLCQRLSPCPMRQEEEGPSPAVSGDEHRAIEGIAGRCPGAIAGHISLEPKHARDTLLVAHGNACPGGPSPRRAHHHPLSRSPWRGSVRRQGEPRAGSTKEDKSLRHCCGADVQILT
jgi:hypothetical protein